MKRYLDHYYDEAGSCPSCGARLRPVPYFRGRRVSASSQTTGGYVRTTTVQVQYADLQPMTGGFCEACDRKRFEAGQKNAPAPTKHLAWAIASLIAFAACLCTILFDLFGLGRGSLGMLTMLVMVAALIAFLVALARYLPARKAHRKAVSGKTDPYPVQSDDALSEALCKAMNDANTTDKSLVCVSTTRMREMKRQNPFG